MNPLTFSTNKHLENFKAMSLLPDLENFALMRRVCVLLGWQDVCRKSLNYDIEKLLWVVQKQHRPCGLVKNAVNPGLNDPSVTYFFLLPQDLNVSLCTFLVDTLAEELVDLKCSYINLPIGTLSLVAILKMDRLGTHPNQSPAPGMTFSLQLFLTPLISIRSQAVLGRSNPSLLWQLSCFLSQQHFSNASERDSRFCSTGTESARPDALGQNGCLPLVPWN